MKLPTASGQYDFANAVRTNQAIEQEDLRNRKKGTDVELGPGEKLILRSPNGSRFSIVVSNAGAISVVAL